MQSECRDSTEAASKATVKETRAEPRALTPESPVFPPEPSPSCGVGGLDPCEETLRRDRQWLRAEHVRSSERGPPRLEDRAVGPHDPPAARRTKIAAEPGSTRAPGIAHCPFRLAWAWAVPTLQAAQTRASRAGRSLLSAGRRKHMAMFSRG